MKKKTNYRRDGSRYEMFIVDEKGKKQGLYIEYCLDGVHFGEIAFYKDNKLNGPYRRYLGDAWPENFIEEYRGYYGKNHVLREGIYENGEEEGEFRYYEPNGELEKITNYKKGKEDGPETFYKHGEIEEVLVWRKGELLAGKEAKDYLREWESTKREKIDVREVFERALKSGEEITEKLKTEAPPPVEDLPNDPLDRALLNLLSVQSERRQNAKTKSTRSGISALLKQVNEMMEPNQTRQSIKRSIVAEFRKKHPKTNGR